MKFIKYLFVLALLFSLFILPAWAQSNISIMPPTNSVVADPTVAAQSAGVAALIGIIPLLVPIVVMLVKMGLPRLPSWSLPIIAVSLGALIDFISSKAHGPGVGPIMGALLGAAGIGVREIVDQLKSRIGTMPTTGLSVLALCLFLTGCGGAKLENGGPYAPGTYTTNSSGVISFTPSSAPDIAFFTADASFDLVYSAANAIFDFEANNRAMLLKLSPDIKHKIDFFRPQAVQIRNDYISARIAYQANPTAPNLSTLLDVLSRMKAVTAAVQAAIPPTIKVQ